MEDKNIEVVGLLTACTAASSSKDMQNRCIESVAYYLLSEDFDYRNLTACRETNKDD